MQAQTVDTAEETTRLNGMEFELEMGLLFDGIPAFRPIRVLAKAEQNYLIFGPYMQTIHPGIPANWTPQVQVAIVDEITPWWLSVRVGITDGWGMLLGTVHQRPGTVYIGGPTDLPTGLVHHMLPPYQIEAIGQMLGRYPSMATVTLQAHPAGA